MVNDAVRQAIESQYEGKCTILVKEQTKVKGVAKTHDVVICQDQKCKLSYKSVDSSSDSDTVSTSYQEIKLFLAPEIEIKEGATITVTQHGKTNTYKRSGVPLVYSNHQEVLLDMVVMN